MSKWGGLILMSSHKHCISLDVFSGAFSCVKWDAVVFEEMQQETLADLSSPALWNCRAVPLQSCIIAESVAKEPGAHAFSWKYWRKSEQKLQPLQNEFLSLLRFPCCWLIRPLYDDDTACWICICVIYFIFLPNITQWYSGFFLVSVS